MKVTRSTKRTTDRGGANRSISRRAFTQGMLATAGGSALVLGGGLATAPARAHYRQPGGCTWPTSKGITPTGSSNEIVDLPYGDKTYIEAKLVFNVDSANGVDISDVFDKGELVAGNDTIVTNLSNAYAEVLLPFGDEPDGIAKSVSPLNAPIIRGAATVVKASAAETPSGADASQPLHLAFIRTSSPRNVANALADSAIWQSYSVAGCWPTGVGPFPLWMSTRAELTGLGLSFDPWQFSNQSTPSTFKTRERKIDIETWQASSASTSDGSKSAQSSGTADKGTPSKLTQGKRSFDIHTNLWWLPAMSDAAVHHCHYANFLEVHTQLMGLGRMQKFTDTVARGNCPSPEIFDMPVAEPPPASGYYGVPGTEGGLNAGFPAMYQEYRLAPGDTNIPFPHVEPDGTFVYPWHQYYADTDCLWVVWELVPTD